MEFTSLVQDIVATIPRGRVLTYGLVAELAGRPRAARAVGTAMRRSPSYLGLPCHRVVSSTGGLAPSGVFGDPSEQRQLLVGEGVSFVDGDRVDLSLHLWVEARTSLWELGD